MNRFYNRIIYLGFILVIVVQPLLTKTYGLEKPLIGLLDDIAFVSYFLLVLFKVNQLLSNKFFSSALFCYFLFLVFGITSFYLSNISDSVKQLIFQCVLDLKLIVFLFAFFLYSPTLREVQRFSGILKIILLIGVPLCVFQYLKPDTFDHYFVNEQAGENFVAGNFEAIRLAGIFPIVGQTAFFTSIAAFYFYFIKKNKFFFFLAVAELIATYQRVEVLTLFLLSSWCYYRLNKHMRFKFIISGCLLLLAMSFFWRETMAFSKEILSSMSFGDIKYSEDPRALVYYYGAVLAAQYFPFGVGFGNYGGFAAEKFDSKLYYQLNFHQMDWFREKDYLTDTYYPHLFGESGWAGFVFYLFCLLFLYKMFKTRVVESSEKAKITFLFAFLYVVSLNAPVLNSAFSLSLVGFVLAIIINQVENTPIQQRHSY